MTYRPTPELAERLRKQAEEEHCSVQDLLSKAASEYLERHTKKAMIATEVSFIKTHFADTLKALGEGA
jgi:hypothetical protein